MVRAALGVTLLGFLVAWATASAVPDRPENPEAKQARLTAKLADAGSLFERRQAALAKGNREEAGKLSRQFNAALQQAAPDLTSVTPHEGQAKTYTKLTMNTAKTKLDVFRFTTPAGKTKWNLDWEFVIPQKSTFTNWYIVPREGTMAEGFRTFTPSTNYAEMGVELPQPNRRFVQPLHGGILQPESAYIIWFAFRDETPSDFYVRVGLTPAAAKKE
jgi:hypothetical protein